MSDATPFPLCWPPGVPRARRKRDLKFATANNLGKCRDDLYRELERHRVTNVVVSTNMPLRLDGLFRAGEKLVFPDNGVAVYFTHPVKGKLVIACDSYRYLTGNLWAIRRTLECIRAIARYGSEQLAEQALGGIGGALPHLTPAAPWWVVLEFSEQKAAEVPMDEIERQGRALSKRYHPDSPLGGDAVRFNAIREALDKARRERGVVTA